LISGKGAAVAPPERDHALERSPTSEPATPLQADLKVKEAKRGRVNLTYRISEERQEWLRRFTFEKRTTVQNVIDAALKSYLPGLPD
jgi:hypothetical protein